jgi:hypothetical protein
MRTVQSWLAGAFAISFVGSSAFAGALVEDRLENPGKFFGEATIDACDNSGGPFITLKGELTLGGISGRVILRNNTKGTHTAAADVTVDAVILEPGEKIQFAKQPPQGGVGGNPWISLQLFDHDWRPISDRVLLGRCVQGLVPMAFGMVLPTDAALEVSAGGCRNHPGPQITLDGELRFGGINGRLTFQNNQKGTHKREEAVDVDFVILEPGESLTFAKQPPLGGAGGNPLMYFQFIDHAGKPLSGEFFLGRCVQLGS